MVLPTSLIRSPHSLFEIRNYDGWFEVVEADSGAQVLKREGSNPTFSPTGRFIIVASNVNETFEVIDLVARRVVDTYEARELSWSHGDSFLYVNGVRDGDYQVVRTLHGARFDLSLSAQTISQTENTAIVAINLNQANSPKSGNRQAPDSAESQVHKEDIWPNFDSACLFCSAREQRTLTLSLERASSYFPIQCLIATKTSFSTT